MKNEWPIVLCPGCMVPMTVLRVVTEDSVKSTGRIVYRCEICQTETERPYKGPELSEDKSA